MMETKWSKVAEGKYAFTANSGAAGSLEIDWNSLNQKATAQMDGTVFEIQRTGFWKNTVEVTDRNGMLLAKIYPEKWFANSSILEYKGMKYRVQLRNRPMAEYAITLEGEDVLAYGIFAEKGKIEVRITGSTKAQDPFFDALLWYLFAPIAHENAGDAMVFQFWMAS